MQVITPVNWKDYELIDSGNFEKLERFGKYITARPEPQAIWSKSLPQAEWEKLADAYFKKDKKDKNNERGEWKIKSGMPEQWFVRYEHAGLKLSFRLGLTSFKHVGLFPEQAENWEFIYSSIKQLRTATPKVLNLFAYTGGASLTAKAAGADVTHLDSVKQVVTWSRENMEASNLNNIRWVVEDALKFVKREAKRGNKYNGIILDPPAYGRGPEGEKWVLEENIAELFADLSKIFLSEDNFFVLNLYSMGFSGLIADNLVKDSISRKWTFSEYGEFFFADKSERKLPLGIFWRGKTL
jgi:23S rRNA (cytosine1962-C5)-methyltransferase